MKNLDTAQPFKKQLIKRIMKLMFLLENYNQKKQKFQN